MSSQFGGEMTFSGYYSFFEIVFTPHGLQRLFGIPSSEVLNKIAWSEELVDDSINILHEQLFYCTNVQQMAVATNAYLVSRLQQQKSISDTNRISHIIHSINIQNGLINIDTLAVTVNMSIRNFERHFMEYTGMPAKLY